MFLKFGELLFSKFWLPFLCVGLLLLTNVPIARLLAYTIIALMVLRKGINNSLPLLAIALAGQLINYAISGYTVIDSLLILAIVFISASVLRTVSNWSYTLSVVAILVLLVSLLDAFVLQQWQIVIDTIYNTNFATNSQYAKIKPVVLVFLKAFYLLSFLVACTMPVMLSRLWQSKLFVPGEFGKEFKAIRIPLPLATFFVVLVAVFYTNADLNYNSIVVAMPLVLAGIALVHFVVGFYRLHIFWLIIFYVLIFFEIAILGAFILALVDSLFDIRSKISASQTQ